MLSPRSQRSLLQDHKPSSSLPAVSLSSSPYHLCRLLLSQLYSSFLLTHTDVSFTSPYHHNPFSLLKAPENLLFTSAFQSGSSSVPEHSGFLDSPVALSSRAAWQSSLQRAMSCTVLSGYVQVNSIQVQNLTKFLLSMFQSVIVSSQK